MISIDRSAVVLIAEETESATLGEIRILSGLRPFSVVRRCPPRRRLASPTTSCRRWLPLGNSAYQVEYPGGFPEEPEDFVRRGLTQASIGNPEAGIDVLSILIGLELLGPLSTACQGTDPSLASIATHPKYR